MERKVEIILFVIRLTEIPALLAVELIVFSIEYELTELLPLCCRIAGKNINTTTALSILALKHTIVTQVSYS